jgi:hypothetical protein
MYAARAIGEPIARKSWELAVNYGPQAAAKVAEFYANLHPGFKVPIEAYLIYQYSPFGGIWNLAHWGAWGYARFGPEEHRARLNEKASKIFQAGKETVMGLPGHPVVLRAADRAKEVAERVLEEAPKFWEAANETAEHLRKGEPFNALGHRVAVTDNQPNDSQKPLQNIDQMLTTFEHRQPPGLQGFLPDPPPLLQPPPPSREPETPPSSPPPHLTATPASAPQTTPVISDQIAATDREMKTLSDNLTYFIPLYTMSTLAGIKDADPRAIIEMVREASTEASDGTKPSIKEVFYRRYGSQLKFGHRVQIWFFNLFGSSSFFSKTVDAYLKNIVSEMRVRLSEARWTEKGENTERLIDDAIHFLDVYKSATFNYSDAKEPIGTLSKYREKSFDKMFGKSLESLCSEFSKTIVKHLSPRVEYFKGSWFLPRFGNWVLNSFVKSTVRHYLPKGILSTIIQANDATRPHHLPFAKALTEAVTEQLQKLMVKLDKGPSPPPPPVPGTKHLKSAIENLFYIVQFSRSNTQESIAAKRKELEDRRNGGGFDEKIHQGIQDSILKGTEVLLHHLAEPENSEEMFTKFGELANVSFASGEVVSQEDYQESKDKLDLVVRNVGARLAKEAVEEEIRAKRPEEVERSADSAFKTHRLDAQTTAAHLEAFSQSVSTKIQRLESGGNSDDDILRDLDSMHRVLKTFSTKEQIANDLKRLPEADREGILRPLTPLYQTIETLTAKLLRLQELQLLHRAHHKMAEDLSRLGEALASLQSAKPPESALEKIPLLLEGLDRIGKSLPANSKEVREEIPGMKKSIQSYEAALQKCASHREKTDHLRALEMEVRRLKDAKEQNRPDERKIALEKIRQTLKQLPAADDKLLNPLIRGLNDLRLPSQRTAFDAAWGALTGEIGVIKTRFESERQEFEAALPSLEAFRAWVSVKGAFYNEYQSGNVKEMAAAGEALALGAAQFSGQVARVQRENQLLLTPRHFGIIGGAALGLLALFNPVLAVGLGSAAYAGVKQIGPLLQGGENRTAAGINLGGNALVGAGASSLVSAIPGIGVPLAVAGATIAGGAAGNRAIDGIIDGGQAKVLGEITNFFDQAYEFLLSGDIYKPLAKLTMQEVVASFETPA